ncbi:four helix bundle protein [Desulfobacca acetoxidans]|uniref:S23 ribosomal protein n=1 Tax=Desulfobacca acetoxidans (strain ATCC 700848 / DSM 11109 / ASRB2) TaxID=880072 RepID=F2ND00_DESAR|nr:four helix bundle protein [Desulfobacca acetoxidans]AEB09574.1 S23 ribosomal protein [Desulfobacca acetoxidans DSM 11109]
MIIENSKPHRKLDAWRKAMQLVENIYRVTEAFPAGEKFGLTAQIRRAAVSVPSNIAEGAADRTVQQFYNYLSNCIGSLNELDTQLEIAFRLRYLTEKDFIEINALLDDCLAVTFGLKKHLAKRARG